MKNKKKFIVRSILIVTPILLILILAVIFIFRKKSNKSTYNLVNAEKTDIKNVISSTGTIHTKGTVEVGTQVSGTVSKVFVNFNSVVKKGQLLALLDTTLLEIAVKQAEAKLMSVKSQYELSLQEYENKRDLYEDNLISKYEFETVKVSKESAYANLLSAQADLDKDQANLAYATIRSPIDGIIIDRDIEEGQTVAASLSSPTLFIIAEDLSNLEIHALVDESDINDIKAGQNVEFFIESDTDNILNGNVREVRLNPETTSNVVNYTVVIDVQNSNNLLLPGMTATIDFIIGQKSNVWALQNSAVRFRPTMEMMKKIKEKISPFNEQRTDNDEALPDMKMSVNDRIMLWYVDNDNNVNVLSAKKGLSDDISTEIIGLTDEQLEYSFITGIVSSADGNSSEEKNNLMNGGFNQGGPDGKGRPPGM